MLSSMILLRPSWSCAEDRIDLPVVVSADFVDTAVLTVAPDGKTVTLTVDDLKLLWADYRATKAENTALRETVRVEREGADKLIVAADELKKVAQDLQVDLVAERARREELEKQRWYFLVGGLLIGLAF